MGQSTNAILFFGFCWDEESKSPWNIGKDYDDHDDEDDSWEDRYARLKGLTEPTVKYPERRAKDGYSSPKDEEYTPDELAAKKAHQAFWAEKSALTEKLGVEIDTHCCSDAPMPYVCIKASKTVTYRGDMNEITSLEVKPEWEPELRAFCEFMGIDISKAKAAWWMVSDWN
jgi:hypothetical protein